ncbi:dihydroflavonol-4-reductase-like [Panicum miliaceum]|uniref:Dihydroflavonol-4-reductase-like n=1 Tax=Panicum miliaceum TaxID=4540 RepID=A0A3L6QTD9_PANMI|nr:dihydroflavonol-4-reductase-like [Panicum miliaceum]
MSRVCCVTGAAGYIGSWLVRKLLDRGCVVHATLRNLDNAALHPTPASPWLVVPFSSRFLCAFVWRRRCTSGDGSKTALLRGLPGAAERLVLFQADIYDAASFEPAIAGSEFVFLVAAPMAHDVRGRRSNSKVRRHILRPLFWPFLTLIRGCRYKDAAEAIVGATRTVLRQCERSKTVRRVIHTGSIVVAAPLREDGGGYKDMMDESCWTPLNLPYGYSDEGLDVSSGHQSLTCLLTFPAELLKLQLILQIVKVSFTIVNLLEKPIESDQ